MLNFTNMKQTKNDIMKNSNFKVGDLVVHRLPMFDSFIHHQATVLKVFKNGKLRIQFTTWAGHINTLNVEPETIKQLNK